MFEAYAKMRVATVFIFGPLTLSCWWLRFHSSWTQDLVNIVYLLYLSLGTHLSTIQREIMKRQLILFTVKA